RPILHAHSHRRHLTSLSSHSPPHHHSFPTRRSSDLDVLAKGEELPSGIEQARRMQSARLREPCLALAELFRDRRDCRGTAPPRRSEEHTSELQSLAYLVCRLLLEKKNKKYIKDSAIS